MYFPLMKMPSTANENGRVASLKRGRLRNRESTQLRLKGEEIKSLDERSGGCKYHVNSR
jgi:hypothetical protein